MTYEAEPKDRPKQSRRLSRRRPLRLVAVAAMAGLAIGAAACSSSSKGANSGGATTTTLNVAAAKSAISTAYTTVFDLSNPDMTPKIAAIQDGSQVSTSFQQAFTSSLAAQAGGAKVNSSQLLTPAKCAAAKVSSPCAHVVYEIDNKQGTSILPSQGYAVYINGQWLMAKATICSLLNLFEQAQGNTATPQGC